MTLVQIQVATHKLVARLETKSAPQTCDWFRRLLPYSAKLIHVRWSGEACWIPLAGVDVPDIGYENATSHPAPGQILLYAGDKSEKEILFPCGGTAFASKVGALAGNHFMTIVEGADALSDIERMVLWEGAKDIHAYQSTEQNE